MNNKKSNIPFASRKQLVIAVALACINIALIAVLAYFLSDVVNPAIIAVCFVALYLVEVSLVGLVRKGEQEYVPEAGIDGLLRERGSVIFKNTVQPISVFNNEGVMVWCNTSMLEVIASEDNPVGKSVESIFGGVIDPSTFGEEPILFHDSIYSAESFELPDPEDGSVLYVVALNDITDLSATEKKYNDSRVCVAYIAIDNIEDVLQYVHEKFRVAVSIVDDKLKAWADSMNATIKSYENDKYIMFFDSLSLDKCIADRFSILDEIRETRVGDGVSITVSIGVARSEGTLRERELAARDAIDLALQRGGDQVVYTNNGATEFYGGRTKAVYKRSNVRSRTFTNQLTALMGRSDNVIIMGHRYGDFDSFGASVGVARIAMLCGLKVNIAVDLRDKNLEPCIRMMQEVNEYSQVFVDNADALDLIGPDTMVVLVDHNNPARSQFADIAEKTNNLVIIDHHRKTDSFGDDVKAYYIEPSCSSSCELVTEMLESAVSSQNLTKQEADMLLAGILLDTKQFTRNTGTRTFGCAQYLRGAGASPGDVYSLFKTAPDDLRKESRFHTSITTYRGNIAISSCDGDTDESYRIIASKAADKMLTLRGIDAAFTLVRIGEHIHISGRSNGTINVQLILERLHGGGHFDVAGAQVVDDNILHVLETLKKSIDDYFDA
ncbi:MAG: DHH family phosphoesterase [Clostridia bacterium]|nr:DHH family phosphoesterase [Clostridia bacterium]